MKMKEVRKENKLSVEQCCESARVEDIKTVAVEDNIETDNILSQRCNILDKKTLRKYQRSTLKLISKSIEPSFGPKGSNTITCMHDPDTAPTVYTKDGFTILKSIKLYGPLEKSIVRDMIDISRNQAKNVGDATSSVAILSHIMFENLAKLEASNKYLPVNIIEEFSEVVKDIKKDIYSRARKDITLDDIYKICMVSTNGNKEMSERIRGYYEKYGFDVTLDLKHSLNGKTYDVEIDGMCLESGALDYRFLTDDGITKTIENPRIYVFRNRIDNVRMFELFDTLIQTNIVNPLHWKIIQNRVKYLTANKDSLTQEETMELAKYSNQLNNMPKDADQYVPTVILTPHVSQDMSVMMNNILDIMHTKDGNIPFAVVHRIDECQNVFYSDISRLCGAKEISSYIDHDRQKADEVAGYAPTPDNVHEFYGSCEKIIVTDKTTTFFNPKLKYDENGNYTETFNNLMNHLELACKGEIETGDDVVNLHKIKKRINSLKGKAVELYIGAISQPKREQAYLTIEDAIQNCKSAILSGYGYGSNLEGLISAYNIRADRSKEKSELRIEIEEIIKISYHELLRKLLATIITDENEIYDIINKMIVNKQGYDLITKDFSYDIIATIETDICVLESISQILTMMVTANQFILPEVNINMYI